MSDSCWINGEPGIQIAADDRGLQYGDGVFETMSLRKGRVTFLEEHIQRLAQGAERLLFPEPPLDLIRDELCAAAHTQQHAILKLTVTRGSSARGYRLPETPHPTRILIRYDWPDYPLAWWRDGVRARICKTILGRNPQLAGLKHLNRLEQVLARAEWNESDDIQEGLMMDADGAVTEGTMTNIFVRLADDSWLTPDLSGCGVDGIMRRHLLRHLEQAGVEVRIGALNSTELHDAKELFVCNSVIGVWPVRQLGDRRYEVGDMTRRAQHWSELE